MLANGRSRDVRCRRSGTGPEYAPLGGVAGQNVCAHALLTAKHSCANPTDKKLVDQYLVTVTELPEGILAILDEAQSIERNAGGKA